MASSTLYTRDGSQVVQRPEAVAFPADVHRVDVLKFGRSRLIVPKGQRWDDFFLSGSRVSDDFMVEREQPAMSDRSS